MPGTALKLAGPALVPHGRLRSTQLTLPTGIGMAAAALAVPAVAGLLAVVPATGVPPLFQARVGRCGMFPGFEGVATAVAGALEGADGSADRGTRTKRGR